ncbi:RanBP2-type zinc finger protein [Glycine max]|nr:RanBP2-type zinc finger protein [Glycine max]
MASTKVNNRGSPGSKRFRNDASRKDGDWTCPNCGNLNFSFRTVCNQGHCGAPRPSLTLTPPAPIISPYRNSHPFYHGGFGIPPPSYGIPSQFGSPIPHPGLQYDYGLYARARAPYSPLPMFPPASFGGINYGPRPRIDGYGYGFQSPPPPWAEGLVADNFASRKRRGGPDGLSEGDWICPRCDNVNFAFRTTCNIKHCGAVKPCVPYVAFIPSFNRFLLGAQTNQIQQLSLKVVGLVKNAVTSTIPFEMYATAKTVEMRKQFLPSDISIL